MSDTAPIRLRAWLKDGTSDTLEPEDVAELVELLDGQVDRLKKALAQADSLDAWHRYGEGYR